MVLIVNQFVIISIHALREEGDGTVVDSQALLFYFYPRPPRGGRQARRSPRISPLCISIHALREEGDDAEDLRRVLGGPISIHALREEGDAIDAIVHLLVIISIHALREEGDSKNRDKISIFL